MKGTCTRTHYNTHVHTHNVTHTCTQTHTCTHEHKYTYTHKHSRTHNMFSECQDKFPLTLFCGEERAFSVPPLPHQALHLPTGWSVPAMTWGNLPALGRFLASSNHRPNNHLQCTRHINYRLTRRYWLLWSFSFHGTTQNLIMVMCAQIQLLWAYINQMCWPQRCNAAFKRHTHTQKQTHT
jgi:hypothetical protein